MQLMQMVLDQKLTLQSSCATAYNPDSAGLVKGMMLYLLRDAKKVNYELRQCLR